METEFEKQLMLDTVGELYTDIHTSETLQALPGQTTSLIADYHNPYDSHNLDYTLHTTSTVLESLGQPIKEDSILQDKHGTHLRVINIVPDLTGWVIIRVSWEDGHVYVAADNN